MPSNYRVFIAAPGYDGPPRASQVLYTASTLNLKMEAQTNCSLLTYNFNQLWCHALNQRSNGVTHFAMLHADIILQPESAYWVDILIDEMDRYDADVMSSVVPLKNSQGLTSTAIDTDEWRPRRLTIRECNNLPETFTANDVPWAEGRNLLVNTGCMVIRFGNPWVERVCFHVQDKIVKGADGMFTPHVMPEDWHFSRQCHQEDLTVMATGKVKLNHIGVAPFPNYGEWGDAMDKANMRKAREI